MALDYSQYLRDKFQEDLEEAHKQFNQNLPLRFQLREILEYIQKEEKFKSSSVLTQMKDCFMKLNDALADCIMFVESSPQKALIGSSSRKILPSTRPCKVYWLLIKTWLRLQAIRREMESKKSDLGGEDDRQETYPFIYAIASAKYPLENVNRVKYYGLDEQAKAIQYLLAQGKQSIGIVGMGGLGKTALARKVLHEMKTHFPGIIWINLTEATDLDKEYSVAIMERYNIYRRKYKFGSLLSDLQNVAVDYIGMHEKTLNVVDGVWHAKDDIRSFTHTVLNRESVAMIVTSRMGGAAKSLVPDPQEKFYLHRMLPLKKEDCWSIFEDSMKRKQLTTTDVEPLRLKETEVFAKIKNEIMEKSCGLPLAAKSLAEVFSIRLGKKPFLTDPYGLKAVVLRVEADPQTLVNLNDKLGLTTRSHDVYFQEMRLVLNTLMDPVRIVKELGPFYHVELISVKEAHMDYQIDWSMLG